MRGISCLLQSDGHHLVFMLSLWCQTLFKVLCYFLNDQPSICKYKPTNITNKIPYETCERRQAWKNVPHTSVLAFNSVGARRTWKRVQRVWIMHSISPVKATRTKEHLNRIRSTQFIRHTSTVISICIVLSKRLEKLCSSFYRFFTVNINFLLLQDWIYVLLLCKQTLWILPQFQIDLI